MVMSKWLGAINRDTGVNRPMTRRHDATVTDLFDSDARDDHKIESHWLLRPRYTGRSESRQ